MVKAVTGRLAFKSTGNKRTWRTVATLFFTLCADYLFLHLSHTLGGVFAKVDIYIIGDFLCNLGGNKSPLSQASNAVVRV